MRVTETVVVVSGFTITVVELFRYIVFLMLILCNPAGTSGTVSGVFPINVKSRKT